MVTIKIHTLHSNPNKQGANELKTSTCPECNVVTNSWEWPPGVCKSCGYELVNINGIVIHQFARLNYHKKGPY